MGSISREFRKYFSIEIPRTNLVDDIIAGQACRHAIVHAGARASTKTIGQLRAAPNRQIKLDIGVGDRIDISSEELKIIEESMGDYVENLIELVLASQHAV